MLLVLGVSGEPPNVAIYLVATSTQTLCVLWHSNSAMSQFGNAGLRWHPFYWKEIRVAWQHGNVASWGLSWSAVDRKLSLFIFSTDFSKQVNHVWLQEQFRALSRFPEDSTSRQGCEKRSKWWENHWFRNGARMDGTQKKNKLKHIIQQANVRWTELTNIKIMFETSFLVAEILQYTRNINQSVES